MDEETSNTRIDEARQAMDDVRRQLAQTPAQVVIINHVMGLYELAAIHLAADPADLTQASLAIDAVACLVDGLGERLGEDVMAMRAALGNIRMAFVQIKNRSAPTAGEPADAAEAGQPGGPSEAAEAGEGEAGESAAIPVDPVPSEPARGEAGADPDPGQDDAEGDPGDVPGQSR